MIVTVSDFVTPNDKSFNVLARAIDYFNNFYFVIDQVVLEGEIGVGMGYFILNATKDNEDFNPPNIIIGDKCNEEQSTKIEKTIQDITKVMSKKYKK